MIAWKVRFCVDALFHQLLNMLAGCNEELNVEEERDSEGIIVLSMVIYQTGNLLTSRIRKDKVSSTHYQKSEDGKDILDALEICRKKQR